MTRKARASVAIWILLAAMAGVGVPAARAAVLYWNEDSGDWDTTTTNWAPGPTTYTDGGVDDVVFSGTYSSSGSHTVDIVPASVTPNSFLCTNGPGRNWEFVGGDIVGSVMIDQQAADNRLLFARAGSYSFTGGVYSRGRITYNPQITAAGGTYQLGTGTIQLNNGGRDFSFEPALSATLDNDFIVQSLGGVITGNANAHFSSNIQMDGDLTLPSNVTDYSGMTLQLTGDRQLNLYSKLSPVGTNFNGDVTGSDYTLTLNQYTGAALSKYVIGGTGGWDIGGLRKIGDANLIVDADGSDFFDGITANAGTVSVEEGRIAADASYTGTFDVGFTLELSAAGTLQATTINVESDGQVRGTGTLTGDVFVADGGTLTPGFGLGTLRIAGDLTLSDGSILDYEFPTSEAVPGDVIAVSGDLVLDGILDASQYTSPNVHTLITYDGLFTDNGLEIIGLSPYMTKVRLTVGGGVVTFQAVPEPTACVLFGTVSLLLSLRRHRARGAGVSQ